MFTFAVGVKDHPVHLLDGNDRRVRLCSSHVSSRLDPEFLCPQVRASYPIVDHTERFVAPHSMSFSPDGTRYASFSCL